MFVSGLRQRGACVFAHFQHNGGNNGPFRKKSVQDVACAGATGDMIIVAISHDRISVFVFENIIFGKKDGFCGHEFCLNSSKGDALTVRIKS